MAIVVNVAKVLSARAFCVLATHSTVQYSTVVLR